MNAAQGSLLVTDHPASITIELRVSARGDTVWGRMIMHERSGRSTVTHIPHMFLSAQVLGLPDDMRDLFTTWLYARPEETRRLLVKAIDRWQDDGEDKGSHPGPNR